MILSKYSSSWLADFNAIEHEIQKELKFKIEHVGSTAVPNLDAKPIIDLDIIYSNKQDLEIIKLGLEKLGYYHNGDQGIEGREVFKRSGKLTNNVLDRIKHHLYVCQANSKALERHILSRNFLRKHIWAREKYQKMKYAIALEANQYRKIYAALKEIYVNDFIDAIINEERKSI
jgi:GrpB-like predicted nucleotidyltransferase (UPF0157 family)